MVAAAVRAVPSASAYGADCPIWNPPIRTEKKTITSVCGLYWASCAAEYETDLGTTVHLSPRLLAVQYQFDPVPEAQPVHAVHDDEGHPARGPRQGGPQNPGPAGGHQQGRIFCNLPKNKLF